MNARKPMSGQHKGAAVVLLLLGVWGALVPFVGPTFGYSMSGSRAWEWTESHATLHLAPGVAAVLGGLLLLASRNWAAQVSGALVAAAGGVWFVIAPSLHPLWAGESTGMMSGGMMHSESAGSSALSSLGYHYGTGALIALVAAYALGVLVASRRLGSSTRVASGEDMMRQVPRQSATRDSALVNH